ncbi:MAG: hypothetical protein ACRDJV_03955 [Actinomycetota bacterium]
MRSAKRLAVLVGLAGVVLLVPALPASAHESRKVGPYEFVVGWADEPTFTGAKNAVSLSISDFQSERPITEDVDVAMDVEVLFEDASTSLTMEPTFSDPSVFEADLAPTRPGEYTFHFVGAVGDLEVDESFTSGPETFNSPVELNEIQFPVQDPSTAELADRFDRELPRVEDQAVTAAENAAATTSDDVDSARLIALIALGLGVVAVILGVVAIVRPGRSGATGATARPSESQG